MEKIMDKIIRKRNNRNWKCFQCGKFLLVRRLCKKCFPQVKANEDYIKMNMR